MNQYVVPIPHARLHSLHDVAILKSGVGEMEKWVALYGLGVFEYRAV